MARMTKAEREVRKLAKAYGLEVRRTKKNHFQFLRGNEIVAVTGSTPSDCKQRIALRADLRRAA